MDGYTDGWMEMIRKDGYRDPIYMILDGLMVDGSSELVC
jgi:hypothetical protein